MKRLKKIVLGILTLVLALSLTACGGSDEASNNTDETVVKVGIVGEMTDHWLPTIEKLSEEDITIEIIKFGDYTLPNQSLADGEIDLNNFQHKAFLENEIKERGYDISSIGNSIMGLLNIYSDKVTRVDEIKENDKIAIPNDVTNGGRALKVLEDAGLIEVDPAVGYTPEIKDIRSNPLNLEIIEVEAAQVPSLLPDVTAAIINPHHANDYGLTGEDAIFAQDELGIDEDNPFVNVIVARTEDVDNPLYKKIVETYQTEETREAVKEAYNGLYIPAF